MSILNFHVIKFCLLFLPVFNVIPVHHVDIPPVNHNPFCRQRSSSLHKSGGIPNVSFSSLPQAPTPQADYVMVQRSYSFGGRSATKRPDSLSRSQNRTAGGLSHVAKRHRPNSIHPKFHNLTHSQSAPSIGFVDPRRKRSHSLQHLDSWEADAEADGVNLLGRPLLRRTSSEVYVDRGEGGSHIMKEALHVINYLGGTPNLDVEYFDVCVWGDFINVWKCFVDDKLSRVSCRIPYRAFFFTCRSVPISKFGCLLHIHACIYSTVTQVELKHPSHTVLGQQHLYLVHPIAKKGELRNLH